MIERLIEFSAKNKLLVIVVTAVLSLAAVQAIGRMRLDAIPDLSDTQVVVYSRWDRDPGLIEDQVTFPVVSSLLGMPKVRDIRAFSDFGFSYVYVIFEDGTDPYWARSRVQEYLSKIVPSLPEGVKTEIGPDATGVGWIYQYALVDRTGKRGIEEIRAFQDWALRYQLQAVPGVAEVAAFGGFSREYQIQPDSNKLAANRVTLMELVEAVRSGNRESGARLVELGGAEFMVRVRGYARSAGDLEKIVVRQAGQTPVTVGDLARVSLVPQMRRASGELNGEGEAVGAIVVMRSNENALNVIRRVKQKIRDIRPSFPPGLELVETYDRSDLIERSIDTLKHQLTEEMIIVSLVILIFLWHIPSAIVPILTIPVAVLLSFLPLSAMGVTSNIMSLAGIAISIGVLVDGAIVEVENAYRKLERWQAGGRKGDFHEVRLAALKEVGPSVFFSLLLIAAAFLPVFALVGQEGKLFGPLALSKNLAMAIAAILALTLDPALRMLFARMDPFTFRPKWLAKLATGALVGRYYSEENHPLTRRLTRIYEPACRAALRHPKRVIAASVLAVVLSIPLLTGHGPSFYPRLGTEFMPALHEGALLFMPTTLPGLSAGESRKLLSLQDRILKSFPEVQSVHGKAGRAETATDPAPLSMMETVVVLKPESEWRERKRWYSSFPEPVKKIFRPFGRDRISYEELITDMNDKLQLPGVSNSWTMPIKNRIDMLSTGIRTPVGVKIFGKDLNEIERTALDVERVLRGVRGTRSVFAERVTGGYFLDFDIDRDALARYGLSVSELQDWIGAAVGGEQVTTLYSGRERYPVTVRFPKDSREDADALSRLRVRTPSGAEVALGELASIRLKSGPSMIRDENGVLAGYVYVDVAGRDVGSFVEEAKRVVSEKVKVPAGTTLGWSGQYENMLRVRQRLTFILPITLFLIVFLLYFNTRSWVKTGIVMLAVPFSLVGAVWLMWALGYHLSIAAWVGMIALMGLDAETGVFMLLYLDISYKEAAGAGRLRNAAELSEAVVHGAARRIRPKLMTVCAAMIGLLPILWSMGAGADVMKRIAAPMIGGLATSFLLELLVYPPVYYLWRKRGIMKQKF